MNANLESAREFFDACETGKGWSLCKTYCHSDATFSAQAHALEEVATAMPDVEYDLRFFGIDESGDSVAAVAVFKGTHTGAGGPVPPTGRSVASDYAYYMIFEDGRIRHMTKVWNDGVALQQAGWA